MAWSSTRFCSFICHITYNVDHIHALSLGGSNDVDNLQAAHWETNRIEKNAHPGNNPALWDKGIHASQDVVFLGMESDSGPKNFLRKILPTGQPVQISLDHLNDEELALLDSGELEVVVDDDMNAFLQPARHRRATREHVEEHVSDITEAIYKSQLQSFNRSQLIEFLLLRGITDVTHERHDYLIELAFRKRHVIPGQLSRAHRQPKFDYSLVQPRSECTSIADAKIVADLATFDVQELRSYLHMKGVRNVHEMPKDQCMAYAFAVRLWPTQTTSDEDAKAKLKLQNMTKAELIAVCKRNDIQGWRGKNKADLIEHIIHEAGSKPEKAAESDHILPSLNANEHDTPFVHVRRQLEGMTIPELVGFAKDNGIDDFAGKTRVDLVDHIMATILRQCL